MSRTLVDFDDGRLSIMSRIEACQGDPDVNDWEEEFLESISHQLKKGYVTTLSDSQEETLEKIEYKVAHGIDAYWEMYGR